MSLALCHFVQLLSLFILLPFYYSWQKNCKDNTWIKLKDFATRPFSWFYNSYFYNILSQKDQSSGRMLNGVAGAAFSRWRVWRRYRRHAQLIHTLVKMYGFWVADTFKDFRDKFTGTWEVRQQWQDRVYYFCIDMRVSGNLFEIKGSDKSYGIRSFDSHQTWHPSPCLMKTGLLWAKPSGVLELSVMAENPQVLKI